MAIRSSLTEITGNRIEKRTAMATSCRRRSMPVRSPMRSHRQTIKTARAAHAKLSRISTWSQSNSSSRFGSVRGLSARGLQETCRVPKGFEKAVEFNEINVLDEGDWMEMHRFRTECRGGGSRGKGA